MGRQKHKSNFIKYTVVFSTGVHTRGTDLPCEDYEYCGSGRKYQQNNNNQSLNEAAKSLEKFVHSNNGEPGDRDRSFDDSDKACVSPGSLIDSGSEEDSAEDLCCPGQCPACHIEDCKLSFEEYFDFSDDTESEEL